MTPNVTAVPAPARETQATPKPPDRPARSVGPESETRGGPEAPDETLEAPAERIMQSSARDGLVASDPPFPPGQPPVLPNPEPLQPPTPIEEPPRPLPVPPNDPPPPIVALSHRGSTAAHVWA